MSISKKRLAKIKAMQDSEIDYSDIPELGASFWKNAKLSIPQKKAAISLRVDSTVLKWFKSRGKGYQSLMNAVLKTYVEAIEKNSRD